MSRFTVFCDACARLYGLKTPEQKMSDLSAEVEMLTAELDRARARIAELEAAAGWRPMDTAPRDGTEIIGRCEPFTPIAKTLELDRARALLVARAFAELVAQLALAQRWRPGHREGHHRQTLRVLTRDVHAALGGRIPDEVTP